MYKHCDKIRNQKYFIVFTRSSHGRPDMKNFVDLARAPSGSNKGDPFLPVKIIPVDLFPHTRGFELVILFERVAWGEILNTEIAKRIRDEETQNLDDMASIADDLQKKRELMDIVE